MLNYLLGVVVWLGCAILTTGLAVAYFENKYPSTVNREYRSSLAFGCAYGLLGGPLSLLIAFFLSGFAEFGLQYRRNVEPKNPQH